MIIRIMGEGQYHVNSCLVDSLNRIDNRIVDHVQAGDGESFKAGLAELVNAVRAAGNRIPDTEIVASDVIVPHADMTLAEAGDVFSGTGIFLN